MLSFLFINSFLIVSFPAPDTPDNITNMALLSLLIFHLLQALLVIFHLLLPIFDYRVQR